MGKLTFVLLSGSIEFVISTAYSLQFPFYPKEAEKRNLSPAEYGFVFSIYEFTAVLFATIAGRIVACCGNQAAFRFGGLIFGVSAILFSLLEFVQSHLFFFFGSCFIRILEATGSILAHATIIASAASNFPTETGKLVGLIESIAGAGYYFGPGIGAALFHFGGFKLPFLVVGILVLILIPFATFKSNDSNQEHEKLDLVLLCKIPNVIFYCFIGGVESFYASFVASILEPSVLRRFNLTTAEISLIYPFIGISYALAGPIWGALLDRFPSYAKIFISIQTFLGIVGISMVGYLPLEVPQIWVPTLGLSILSLGTAGIYVTSFVIILEAVRDSGYQEDSATVNGLIVSSAGLGLTTGPLAAGITFQHLGQTCFIVPFAASLLTLVLVLFHLIKGK